MEAITIAGAGLHSPPMATNSLSDLAEVRDELQELLSRVEAAQARLDDTSIPETASNGERTGQVETGEAPVLAFVHIPKTAGGTATKMLVNAYTRAGKQNAGNYMTGREGVLKKIRRRPGGWEDWYRGGGRVTVGHVPYSVFRDHLPAEARYMAFLREPIDRVISHYFRHIYSDSPRPPKPDQSVYDRRASSIEEATIELGMPQMNNLMTRFLCSEEDPFLELPPNAVDDAKENLSRFAFVGIQERFDESAALLQRLLELDFIPAEDRHVNTDRPAVDELPPDDLALIREHNQLDAELYEFGVSLFEEAVAETGDDLGADARKLRDLSAAANEAYEQDLESGIEWLDGELPHGVEKPESVVEAEAEAAGITDLILKRARRRSDIQRIPDPGRDGEYVWRRKS